MKKISIIIPVYNVEKYLREALDSLLAQTYTNWEAICIDDGSSDNSLGILNEYAQEDSRFVIVKQKNSGASAARNKGLKMAAGEYIMFLDSDDLFEKNACELALNTIEKHKSDVAIFGYHDLFGDKRIPNYRNTVIDDIISGKKDPEFSIFVTIWMKIFKKSFLLENNIFFLETQDVSEDMMFSYEVLLNGAKISLINESLYLYRRNRENSLTTRNINGIKSEIRAAEYMIKNPMFNKASEEMKMNFVAECFRNCLYYFYKFKEIDKQIIIYLDSLKMIKFWEKIYDKKTLESLNEYQQVKIIYKMIWKNFLKILFPEKKYSDDFKTFLSEVKFEKSFKQLKREIGKRSVILYGAGSFLEYILNNYDLSEFNIIGISDLKFTDENIGQKVLGYNVIPKDKMIDYKPDYVLVSAKNYENILKDFKNNIFNETKIKTLPLVKKS